ncbi:hypothetical protein CTAYLR_005420 [Chrysophaeum taylorii]|uniref:ATP synthase subunit gamma, mitochondrial n=1 Tax=Chrysophaeum taylorii TaxID=2483200 RepID=A0AAD7XKN1_9STRA|nr:hypothetical protein CTAYLR_005420 [Chrysophaeum taylorii]
MRRIARRTFATEKEIAMRISATKNIKKITSSMKMVSASKLRGDQNRLDAAKHFSAWTSTLGAPSTPFESLKSIDGLAPGKNVVVAITSDKGLCGGVHSAVCRGVRSLVNAFSDADIAVIAVGEKGRTQLRRMVGPKLDVALTDLSMPFSFALAAQIAEKAFEHENVGAILVAYNQFKSAISYIPTLTTITPFTLAGENETLQTYDFDPPEAKDTVLDNLYEYYVAAEIFYGLCEAATSEQSSRMQAMENASKNAGELIDKLTLLYNRARQARITTELIEIISGASALD